MESRISLDDATELTRTGDIWLFRGASAADRAIQLTTNSPINHVGMEIVVEGYRAKDGTHKGVGRSLTFADGRKLFLSESTPGGRGEPPKR